MGLEKKLNIDLQDNEILIHQLSGILIAILFIYV